MAQDTLTVQLNGEARELASGTTVAALLASLPDTQGRVAVEVNRAIVPRSTHGEHVLEQGDTVEIVSFVGGG
jgi:sulfur carrier protein